MRRLGPAWLAGIMLGLAAEWVGFGWDDPRRWIPDLAVGWTLIGCGLIAWARRPESRTGPLMAATGFTWFLGNFAQLMWRQWPGWQSIRSICIAVPSSISCSPTRPGGQSRHSFERRGRRLRGGDHHPDLAERRRHDPLGRAAAGRLRPRICPGGRPNPTRARIALQATAGLSLVLSGTAAARLVLPPGDASGPSLLVYEAALCVLAGGLLAGLLIAPWQRAAVADLVVELGEARSGTLRGELSRALGDPTLEIGYWLSDRGCSSTPRAGCCRFPMPALGAR